MASEACYRILPLSVPLSHVHRCVHTYYRHQCSTACMYVCGMCVYTCLLVREGEKEGECCSIDVLWICLYCIIYSRSVCECVCISSDIVYIYIGPDLRFEHD